MTHLTDLAFDTWRSAVPRKGTYLHTLQTAQKTRNVAIHVPSVNLAGLVLVREPPNVDCFFLSVFLYLFLSVFLYWLIY